jgi:prepilin signal peptidase PulO-like enzyme (type II secretory pathway)
MFDRIARWQPDRGAAVAVRTVGALALIALAVMHVVDLPGTLGPDRLVGIGYLGIIAAAVLIGGVLLARSSWLAWAAAAAVAVSAMGGYILTRALPGDSSAITATSVTGAARSASPRSAWSR